MTRKIHVFSDLQRNLNPNMTQKNSGVNDGDLLERRLVFWTL
jgi:hypothetical protein